MPTTYFCTTQYLRTNTNIGNSVDENTITPLVKTTAEMWSRSILGTYFFNYLLTKFNAQTLNADETTLVANYLKPAIAWKTAADVTVNQSLLLRNKGVQTQSGDFSAASDFKAMAFIQRTSFEKGSFYENLLFEYLKENRALYPQFESPLNTDSTAKEACNGNTSGFQSNILFI